MLQLRLHKINKKIDFIRGYYIDHSICDYLITLHQNNPEKYRGAFKDETGSLFFDEDKKKSTESYYYPNNSSIGKYIEQLLTACSLYANEYPYCNFYSPWGFVEPLQIQHYKPNEGYTHFHTERTSANKPGVDRHLVFMTYLNDVEKGGETEFFHQKLKVKPEKGLTIIWPADWTFTHRGTPCQYDKTIITGWLSYLPTNQKNTTDK